MQIYRQKYKLFVFLITLILFFLIINVGAKKQDDVPRIQIPDGKLKGVRMYTTTGRPIDAYLGIPYASPPVGQLRFKAPIDPIPWSEEKDATKAPPLCIQLAEYPDYGNVTLLGEEDCLFLNVFKPKKLRYPGPVPVLLHIYGGALIRGAALIENEGPDFLLNEEIVLVTFNHRLEILGFLSTGDDVAPGNYAFKDQVAVLKWVRKNIHYFNGDPEQVTLYGLSSGAYSAHYHILSPMSKGLFQKVISSSGTIYTVYPYSRDLMVERAKILADYVKCPTHDSALLVKCLQYTPLKEMYENLHKFRGWNGEPRLIFGPIVESSNGNIENNESFITVDSLSYSNITIPWMVGLNSEDLLGIICVLSLNDLKELDSKFNKLAPVVLRYYYHPDKEKITNSVRQFYFKGEKFGRRTIPQLTKLWTDAHYLFGILISLTKHKGPVYLYYFSHRGQYAITDNLFLHPEAHKNKDDVYWYIKNGVSHAEEQQYFFPTMEMFPNRKTLNFTETDKLVSDRLIKVLIDFIYHRQPSDLDWKPSSLENLEYMHMDTSGFTMKENLLHDRTHFWSHWIPTKEMSEKIFRDEL